MTQDDCLPRAINASIGEAVFETPDQLTDVMKLYRKIGKEQIQKEVWSNGGFRPTKLGPIIPNKNKDFYEIWELRVVDQWDHVILSKPKQSMHYLEIAFSKYKALFLIMVYEYRNQIEEDPNKVHAVALRYDHNHRGWLNLDTNEHHRVALNQEDHPLENFAHAT